MISGKSLSRDLPGGSGAQHRQHICPECFTRTHTETLAHPDVINVRPGTLDDPTVATPIARRWTRLAHPWAIAPGVRRLEEGPVDIEWLVAEWRERFG